MACWTLPGKDRDELFEQGIFSSFWRTTSAQEPNARGFVFGYNPLFLGVKAVWGDDPIELHSPKRGGNRLPKPYLGLGSHAGIIVRSFGGHPQVLPSRLCSSAQDMVSITACILHILRGQGPGPQEGHHRLHLFFFDKLLQFRCH